MSTTNIHKGREVGQIVREQPSAAPVFETFGIDYCCNGNRSLEDAALTEGVNPSRILEELAALAVEDERNDEWESLDELIEHIESTHHDYLRSEIPPLSELVAKVRVVHVDEHPELAVVHRTFNDLADEMLTHIREEEETVFPIIVRLHREDSLTGDERQRLRGEIKGLEKDHEETAANLDRLDALTDGFAVPDSACPSYEVMLDRLAVLKRNTHQHVHKENNILFRDIEPQLE